MTRISNERIHLKTKLADVEIAQPLADIEGLNGYVRLQALVRLHGQPLGWICLPVVAGRVQAAKVGEAILKDLSWQILRAVHRRYLTTETRDSRPEMEELLANPPPMPEGELPSITVAVCTRDRAAELTRCLDALSRLRYPALDCLVVDNAPSDPATRNLVAKYPNIRYAREAAPGLDNARNRAVAEATGDIVAFTDDDCVPDDRWAEAIGRLFAENPEVGAMTGLVVPYELETEAQVLFERCGGFSRGFERRWIYVPDGANLPWGWVGSGQFGTGANMAFRRSLFDRIGHFDPALDVGTASRGGGDLEIFFRALQEKQVLVYEPAAIVRHRHRPELPRLMGQLEDNGAGLAAYMVRAVCAYPSEWASFARLFWWWLLRWIWPRYRAARFAPGAVPSACVAAECRGFFSNLNGYRRARRKAAAAGADFSRCRANRATGDVAAPRSRRPKQRCRISWAMEAGDYASRASETAQAESVEIAVLLWGEPLGQVECDNRGRPLSAGRFADIASSWLLWRVVERVQELPSDQAWAEALVTLRRHLLPVKPKGNADKLEESAPVSVVIATRDRPRDLRRCLGALARQRTERPIEVVVVDNNPASGLTGPVVREFPNTVYVEEARPGLSYARNAGFLAAKGEVLIATDDDVSMPENWVEKIVAPFSRPDVGIVTGNVRPASLDTEAACLFESYGGLGRGHNRWEVGPDWFDSFRGWAVPTWDLGATANAAFRATLIRDRRIGLMDERLGAGSPTGCSEDTYVFYKALKTGYTICYEPAAYVWHHHRASMPALRRQIFNYSKGHVAYHLLTWREQGDWRALGRLLRDVPVSIARRAVARLRGRSEYPLTLLFEEARGSLLGPWALRQSEKRVQRLGRCAVETPVPGADRPKRRRMRIRRGSRRSLRSPALPPSLNDE